MIIDRYLIVDSQGEIRIAKRLHSSTIRTGEIAIHLALKFSDAWGKVIPGQIEIHMPEPPQVLDTEVKE